MGLLSNFLILLTMATYRHSIPGSILASRRVIVSDAITNGNTDIEIQQPANSTLDSCVVRALDDITLDASGTVSFRCGKTAHSGTDAIASTTWLSSGTELKAGAVKLADGANGVRTNGGLSVVSTEDRNLFFRIVSDQAATAPDNGRIEVTLVFRIFD